MTTELSIAAIFERALHVYATCRSYQDEGLVVSTILSGPHASQRQTSRKPFRTAFVRPDHFRFEFTEEAVGPESEWTRYVVWADGTNVRSWWTLEPQVEHHESVSRALAGPTGISGGSAWNIPSLVLRAARGRPFFPPAESTRLIGRELVGDAECYRLETTDARGHVDAFWIDAQQFVVRQMREEDEADDDSHRATIERIRTEPGFTDAERAEMLRTSESAKPLSLQFVTWTYYSPQLDVEIAPSTFEFEPGVTRTSHNRATALPDREHADPAAVSGQAEVSPASILERVARTYGACRSYRDEGEFVAILDPLSAAPDTQRFRFRTSFVRPDRLRFEMKEEALGPESEWTRCVVWADGKQIRSWWSNEPGVMHHDSFADALVGPHVLLGSPATSIPSLLFFTELFPPVFPLPESTHLVGLEVLGDSDCYRLEGTDARGESAAIWVDVKQFVIRQRREASRHNDATRRKTLERVRLPPDHTEEDDAFLLEILAPSGEESIFECWSYYRPELDVEIDPSTFEFEPPT